jgi:hypothetical protein
MKWVRFSQIPATTSASSAEDLMKALADFFLESGFESLHAVQRMEPARSKI